MNNIKQFIIKQNWKHVFAFLLILWFAINIIQALFTEVISDEAYYLVYGENLAWGYFDHPPVVGLMTFISRLLFDGNMSVRFMTVVFQIFTIFVVWKLLDEKQPDTRKVILFFVITASMMWFLSDKMKFNFYLSKVVAIGVVTVWNFGMNFMFTFANR
jgi:4-amino-4-deoxy-L-arabinose transferase-like glycosyltransferase